MSWRSDCAYAAADSRARDNALNDAGSYSKRSADFQDAHSLESEAAYAGFNRRRDWTSPQLGTPRLRPSQPCIDPFPNNASLKFGKYTQHLKHGLACGGRS